MKTIDYIHVYMNIRVEDVLDKTEEFKKIWVTGADLAYEFLCEQERLELGLEDTENNSSEG